MRILKSKCCRTKLHQNKQKKVLCRSEKSLPLHRCYLFRKRRRKAQKATARDCMARRRHVSALREESKQAQLDASFDDVSSGGANLEPHNLQRLMIKVVKEHETAISTQSTSKSDGQQKLQVTSTSIPSKAARCLALYAATTTMPLYHIENKYLKVKPAEKLTVN